MMSPTTRSLTLLRKDGYIAWVVEKYNVFAHVRIDLFGFIDIVAIHPKIKGVLGVQSTTVGNMSKRISKIKSIPTHALWLSTGNSIQVHGWAKKGKVGKRKLWQVNITEIK